jgi:hypothetical protein
LPFFSVCEAIALEIPRRTFAVELARGSSAMGSTLAVRHKSGKAKVCSKHIFIGVPRLLGGIERMERDGD